MSKGRQYRFIGVLGEGGFGTVYLADELNPPLQPRRVAVKLLRMDASDPRAIKAIQRECGALAALNHARIVSFFDLVKLDGRLAIVMAYVPGASLHELAQATRLPGRVSLEITSQVAEALHAAHVAVDGRGVPLRIIHRDVKPANVMVTPQGEVKLLDFGLARTTPDPREPDQTAPVTAHTGTGTAGYLSPEVEKGGPRRASAAGDVFSLGVILHELLVGERLYGLGEHRQRYSALRRVAEQTFLERLGEDHPAFPLVFGMLSFEPEDRPSAQQVAEQASDLAFAVRDERLSTWAPRVVASRARRADDLPRGELGGRAFLSEPIQPEDDPAWWRRLGQWVRRIGLAHLRLNRWLKRVTLALGTVATLAVTARQLLPDAPPQPALVIDADHDGAPLGSDCDDRDAAVRAVSAWFPDKDGDTWGEDAGRVESCHQPGGAWVVRGEDPDDADASVYPGAPQTVVEVSPVEAPPPRPPKPAHVTLTGDATSVTLGQGSSSTTIQTHQSADLQPGRYTLSVRFAEYPSVILPDLPLSAGQSVTLRCRSDSLSCTP